MDQVIFHAIPNGHSKRDKKLVGLLVVVFERNVLCMVDG